MCRSDSSSGSAPQTVRPATRISRFAVAVSIVRSIQVAKLVPSRRCASAAAHGASGSIRAERRLSLRRPRPMSSSATGPSLGIVPL